MVGLGIPVLLGTGWVIGWLALGAVKILIWVQVFKPMNLDHMAHDTQVWSQTGGLFELTLCPQPSRVRYYRNYRDTKGTVSCRCPRGHQEERLQTFITNLLTNLTANLYCTARCSEKEFCVRGGIPDKIYSVLWDTSELLYCSK